jgi:hypothetical protein
VDVLNLLGGLGVEIGELLTGWGSDCFLEVGVQARKEVVGLLSDSI